MKKLKKMVVTFTLPIDYTESANEVIEDGEVKTLDELKEFYEGEVCEALTMHLLQYSDIISDLTFDIEEE